MAAGIAHVAEMLDAGLSVGLGNDGFAGSNDSADLFREMDLAAKLQKITRMDPTVLPAEQVFEMATMGGARVLGLQRQIGSLEAGKRADLITVTLKNSTRYHSAATYTRKWCMPARPAMWKMCSSTASRWWPDAK